MVELANLNNWKEKQGFEKSETNLKLYYTPIAYTKTVQLLKSNDFEIGWNMTVKPYKDGYKVFDVFVYPQLVNPVHIHVDVDYGTWGLWKAMLPEKVESTLFGHGHSHVDMGAFVSGEDEYQQYNEVSMKQNGFYLFQVWNKKLDVVTVFYDIDNKVYYTDVHMIIEEVDNFIAQAKKMVKKEKPEPMEVGEDFGPEQVV